MAYENIFLKQKSFRCLLCLDGPCRKVCPEDKDIARIIRAVRFNNLLTGKKLLETKDFCDSCDGKCMEVCNAGKIDRPINIPEFIDIVKNVETSIASNDGVDLSIDYLGVKFENPFIICTTLKTINLNSISKAFDLGWAGVSIRIDEDDDKEKLSVISQLKEKFPDKRIIASIRSNYENETTHLAIMMEKMGADMIECNFSYHVGFSKNIDSCTIKNVSEIIKFVNAAESGTKLPVTVKITPTINGCSKLVSLKILSDMRKNSSLKNLNINGIGGIENCDDAYEFISLGCSIVEVTQAIDTFGFRIIEDFIEGMKYKMVGNGIKSVKELVGISFEETEETDAHYCDSIKVPELNPELCVSCGRCSLSCNDSGHQAISKGEDGCPKIDLVKCDNCGLCVSVCTPGALTN